MKEIAYTLLINGRPASDALVDVIQQIDVEDHADLADILRLRIDLAVREDGADWTWLDHELFRRLSPISLKVEVGGDNGLTLIDAYVIDVKATFSNEPGQSMLEVVAMDSTALMNLEERIREWPDMTDADIASTIFDEHKLAAVVSPTQPTRQSVDRKQLQRCTDIQFLKQLAWRNGFQVYVETNPKSGTIEGHFHPPKVDLAPQGVLTVNTGDTTNVDRFNARFQMLSPTTARSASIDIESRATQTAESTSFAVDALGKSAALGNEKPRSVLLARSGLSQTGELQTLAQATVDRSGWAIVADGELNVTSYEDILRAKRPVNVRGVGKQFSGTYMVEKVHHTFTSEGYEQRFTLRRNATGLRGREKFSEDKALPSKKGRAEDGGGTP